MMIGNLRHLPCNEKTISGARWSWNADDTREDSVMAVCSPKDRDPPKTLVTLEEYEIEGCFCNPKSPGSLRPRSTIQNSTFIKVRTHLGTSLRPRPLLLKKREGEKSLRKRNSHQSGNPILISQGTIPRCLRRDQCGSNRGLPRWRWLGSS